MRRPAGRHARREKKNGHVARGSRGHSSPRSGSGRSSPPLPRDGAGGRRPPSPARGRGRDRGVRERGGGEPPGRRQDADPGAGVQSARVGGDAVSAGRGIRRGRGNRARPPAPAADRARLRVPPAVPDDGQPERDPAPVRARVQRLRLLPRRRAQDRAPGGAPRALPRHRRRARHRGAHRRHIPPVLRHLPRERPRRPRGERLDQTLGRRRPGPRRRRQSNPRRALRRAPRSRANEGASVQKRRRENTHPRRGRRSLRGGISEQRRCLRSEPLRGALGAPRGVDGHRADARPRRPVLGAVLVRARETPRRSLRAGRRSRGGT